MVVDGEIGATLPLSSQEWPAHRDLAELVGDSSALPAAPPWREDDGLVTHLLVSRAEQAIPDGARWHPIRELGGLAVSVPAREGIVRSLAELRAGPQADGRPTWYSLTWRSDVVDWVAGLAGELGSTLRGEPETVKVWSLSAILRFPVTHADAETDVWFKASCEGFRSEPTVTAALADLAPDLMPSVLAVDEQRSWMLLEHIAWSRQRR